MKKLKEIINSNKEEYDLFHALKNKYDQEYEEVQIALATCIIGDFTDCVEFFDHFYDELHGEEHAFERAIVEFFNWGSEGWKVGDFVGTYDEIDNEYLSSLVYET